MKYQALFSSEDKSKNNKSVVCCNFFCALRVRQWVHIQKKQLIYYNGLLISQTLISQSNLGYLKQLVSQSKFSGTRKFTLRYH